MKLTKLFEAQQILENRIISEHPELRDQDNIPWKLLALQTELGECANEWRGFKRWSHDQEPRIHVRKRGLITRAVEYHNPLLEEYVDGLHLVLSIGLELTDEWVIDEDYAVYRFIKSTWNKVTTIEQFQVVYREIADFSREYDVMTYIELVSQFLGLGEMLGFTWNQIELAYISKNEVNLRRQENGY